MPSILIVDDEEDIRWSLKQILRDQENHFLEAESGRAALQILQKTTPDIVILDLRMPELDGLDTLEKLLLIEPFLPVVILTGVDSVKSAVQAMKVGAVDYLVKPVNHEELRIVVSRALEHVRLKREVLNSRSLSDSTHYVFGRSEIMQRLNETIHSIAGRDVRVLIQGESGTGKQMVAEQLYLLSPRSDKPFVTIDCGVLPETLMESEFFGYEKGAFTGASTRKIGKLEVAKGGTLFLDEIGNMNIALQSKLLRVLETGQFERLGANSSLLADFRLIIATNSNLQEMIRRGAFRSDLYYRINVFTIEIPPLRDHPQDIPELVEFFRNTFNQKHDKKVVDVSHECMEMLIRYQWPGNIRQLRNVLERAILLATDRILPIHMPLEVQRHDQQVSSVDRIANVEVDLQTLEERALREALELHQWNKTRAAAELGISLRTLYYWLKRYNIARK
ncbi:sigma-54 dependent transcriptional regulator [bacterium]|nr:sigma-54 dependent transcriptional regulator [bacterium]MCI0605524.1 sigma-54 dependent transcriptional regulator [bacterium]